MDEILHYRPQYGWVLTLYRHLRQFPTNKLTSSHNSFNIIRCVNQFKPYFQRQHISKTDLCSVFYRWKHCSNGEISFFSTWIQTAVCYLCWDLFMWCFQQFSALYPEMVDSVILLDSLGFLPTDSVITIFYGQYSV